MRLTTPMSRRWACRLAISAAVLAAPLSGAIYAADFFDTHRGKATFYGYGGGGNCSLPVPEMATAAMNHTDYANAQACGACVEVTNANTQQSVVVRIDDQCPECAPGDIDLSESAFLQIGPREAGILPIQWRYVDCSYASMKLYFKEGSSQWWTAVQVREHRYPIQSVEYRASGGNAAFQMLPREPYNYFLAASGMGPGPYDIRITDVHGQTVVASSVPLIITTPILLNQQFAAVPGPAPTPPICSDGADNDGDGKIDYPADPGCANASDTDERDPTTPLPLVPARVTLAVFNDWGNGYCATVTVTNPNDRPLTWQIAPTVSGQVYTAWNARWSQSGNVLNASGVDWNATLTSGGAADFGYCANK